jgi:hypothetical protein
MNRKSMLTIVIATVWLAVLGGFAISAQDKYTVKVPGGSRSLSSGDTKHGRLSPSGRAQRTVPTSYPENRMASSVRPASHARTRKRSLICFAGAAQLVDRLAD